MSLNREKKRMGRGLGSGKGKTGGRGTKGQKARGTVRKTFAGSNLPLYKKLPLRRGLGNGPVSVKPKPISLSKLSVFKAGSEVTLNSLLEQGLLNKDEMKSGVKILNGELKVKLTIKLPVSKQVKETVERLGGRVDV
jgi:large subunit ribosomal protein L15